MSEQEPDQIDMMSENELRMEFRAAVRRMLELQPKLATQATEIAALEARLSAARVGLTSAAGLLDTSYQVMPGTNRTAEALVILRRAFAESDAEHRPAARAEPCPSCGAHPGGVHLLSCETLDRNSGTQPPGGESK